MDMPLVVDPVVASMKCPLPPVASSMPMDALSLLLLFPEVYDPKWNSITLVPS